MAYEIMISDILRYIDRLDDREWMPIEFQATYAWNPKGNGGTHRAHLARTEFRKTSGVFELRCERADSYDDLIDDDGAELPVHSFRIIGRDVSRTYPNGCGAFDLEQCGEETLAYLSLALVAALRCTTNLGAR